jgi:hypothetical protein
MQNALADRRRAFAPGGIQLAGFARITVMLGEDAAILWQASKALACHWRKNFSASRRDTQLVLQSNRRANSSSP